MLLTRSGIVESLFAAFLHDGCRAERTIVVSIWEASPPLAERACG
jgi:hypothetical protein